MTTFSQWLQNKFLEWEKSTGRRQTYTAFARYLGVRQPSLARWLNDDNPPSYKYTDLLAKKLGDEIYDILGLPRPLHFIRELEIAYETFTPEQWQALVEKLQKILSETDENGIEN